MKKLLFAAALLIFFAASQSAVCAQSWDDDDLSLKSGQVERGESRGAMDFFIFPSRVEFNDVSVLWGEASDGTASATISLSPTISSQSFERPVIEHLFADISADEGKTWSYTKFIFDPKVNVWSATINIPEWGKDKDSAPKSAPGPATATGTAGLESRKQAKAFPEDKPKQYLMMSFWAQDSLGNVTTEMARQTAPMSEPEVRFQPLVIDAADPKRDLSKPVYETSPDRDILDTAGAWLRDFAFFRMRVGGHLIKIKPSADEHNYFIIRFVPIETTSFLAQLGKGTYQYFSINPGSNGFLERKETEGIPFSIDYDAKNLHQLAAVIDSYKKGNKYDPKIAEYVALLKKEGMEKVLTGKFPPPTRRTAPEMGIVVRYAMDSVYWRVNMDGFKTGGKIPRGVVARFYTAFLRDKESTSPIMDDRTGYSTIYFEHRVAEKGKATATIQRYDSANAEENIKDLYNEPEMDEMDLLMQQKIKGGGLRGNDF